MAAAAPPPPPGPLAAVARYLLLLPSKKPLAHLLHTLPRPLFILCRHVVRRRLPAKYGMWETAACEEPASWLMANCMHSGQKMAVERVLRAAAALFYWAKRLNRLCVVYCSVVELAVYVVPNFAVDVWMCPEKFIWRFPRLLIECHRSGRGTVLCCRR